uniref:Uncharacterized protein n=1 Tax=uncultured Caudovirales phage TaxID=2100421 RepID=A0A6J5L0V1_9CAUD|nr:hypothetical protein UFOVP114_24 [uncultured Caudovirales phage]
MTAEHCPTCGRAMPGPERRRLTASMVLFLDWLAYQEPGKWHLVANAPVISGRPGGGDWGKLRHWGLIETAPKRARILALGLGFAQGVLGVPSSLTILPDGSVTDPGKAVTRGSFPT